MKNIDLYKALKIVALVFIILLFANSCYEIIVNITDENVNSSILSIILIACVSAMVYIILFCYLSKWSHISDLKSYGLKIEAEIYHIITETNQPTETTFVNPIFCPYQCKLFCRAIGVNNGIKYISKYINNNTECYVGNKIFVYVDPKNRYKYYVDVEELADRVWRE